MTDPRFTVVYFAVGFLLFCGVAAAVETWCEWREQVERRRVARRTKVLVDRYTRDKLEAPDYIPDWMMENAA